MVRSTSWLKIFPSTADPPSHLFSILPPSTHYILASPHLSTTLPPPPPPPPPLHLPLPLPPQPPPQHLPQRRHRHRQRHPPHPPHLPHHRPPYHPPPNTPSSPPPSAPSSPTCPKTNIPCTPPSSATTTSASTTSPLPRISRAPRWCFRLSIAWATVTRAFGTGARFSSRWTPWSRRMSRSFRRRWSGDSSRLARRMLLMRKGKGGRMWRRGRGRRGGALGFDIRVRAGEGGGYSVDAWVVFFCGVRISPSYVDLAFNVITFAHCLLTESRISPTSPSSAPGPIRPSAMIILGCSIRGTLSPRRFFFCFLVLQSIIPPYPLHTPISQHPLSAPPPSLPPSLSLCLS